MKNNVSEAAVGTTLLLDDKSYEVGPSCGGSAGWWICLAHPDDEGMGTYRTQLQKDIHIDGPGSHVLAWVCPVHGLEKPTAQPPVHAAPSPRLVATAGDDGRRQ